MVAQGKESALTRYTAADRPMVIDIDIQTTKGSIKGDQTCNIAWL